MTEGIKQLTKKNMHDVSNAINGLDTTSGSASIDMQICNATTSNGSEHSDDTKCAADSTRGSGGTNIGLAKVMSEANAVTNFSSFDKKLGEVPRTSSKISKDISKLNREQKGVVSSAFAKAHEGSEIVEIRSISTTSVMVNACASISGNNVGRTRYTSLMYI